MVAFGIIELQFPNSKLKLLNDSEYHASLTFKNKLLSQSFKTFLSLIPLDMYCIGNHPYSLFGHKWTKFSLTPISQALAVC